MHAQCIDHVIDKKLTLVVVSNDALKTATENLFEKYGALADCSYSKIFATEGTAKCIRPWLNTPVEILGHGPGKLHCGPPGDWDVIRVMLAEGKSVELFFFKDAYVESHQLFKDALSASALHCNWKWYPTPSTAQQRFRELRLNHLLGLAVAGIDPAQPCMRFGKRFFRNSSDIA